LISITRATISGAPNFGYQYCSEYLLRKEMDVGGIDLTNWRVAFTGAECISNNTVREFSAMLSVAGFSPEAWYPCYGLAESTLMVSSRQGIKRCSLLGDGNVSYISVGPVNKIEVTIKRSSGINCEDLEPGEIHIFSPSVTGYSENGYSVNTGDIGFLSKGELYIVGRQSNVIKYHGQKVFLEELEDRLMECLVNSGVQRCLVVPNRGANKLFLIVESVTRTKLEISHGIRDVATPVLSEFLGDTKFFILYVPRGGIKTTSSGKPDREKNIEMAISMFNPKN
jgi:acyl-CoA synthetase (AMP-forming)/AMP-acid ligase II